MNRGCIEQLIKKKSFALSLLEKLVMVLKGCKDIRRLTAILNVATGLLDSVSESKEILKFICGFLLHDFPRIRSFAAEKLYVRLLETDPELAGGGELSNNNGDINNNNNSNRGIQILLSYNWECNEIILNQENTTFQEILKAFEIDVIDETESSSSECSMLT